MKIIATVLIAIMTLIPFNNAEEAKQETHYEQSEQASALLTYEDDYELCICELYSTAFGYQYNMHIWVDGERIADHGVDAKQHGEMDMIMEFHTDCFCELWYIVVDESAENYDFILYLHSNGAWNTFYGILA